MKKRHLALFLVGLAACVGAYQAGQQSATLAIAKSCYLDNGFDADGVGYWCGDINDYADASTTPAPSTTLVNN